MAREYDARPHRTPARKTAAEVTDERGGNTDGDSREEFDLRAERSDPAVWRAASRDDSASVHEKIKRHKAQARQFTEHAAKPVEAPQGKEIPGGVTADGVTPEPPQAAPSLSVTGSVAESGRDRPDTSERVAPPSEPTADTAKTAEPLPEPQRLPERQLDTPADGHSSPEDTPLRHERP
ncbi:MAG: hypothetical protein LBV27_00545, partial [Oscillospiraceae bacterium]|nr:hypothetical protein [Oscillospiraceae bacterium]